MRTRTIIVLAGLGLALAAPVTAQSGERVVRGNWGGVPTLPLNTPRATSVPPTRTAPPVARAPLPAPVAVHRGSQMAVGHAGPDHGGPRPGFDPRIGPGWGWAGNRWHGVGPGWTGQYHRPARGWRLPSYFVTPRFFVPNWGFYGLARPAPGYNWVRYYDDAVLVDGNGLIRDHARVDWDRGGFDPRDGASRDYDDGYDDGYEDGFDDGVDHAEDQVTWGGSWGYRGNGVYAPAGSTVVVVQGAPTVTTTTTTTTYVTEDVSYAPARAHWKHKAAPRKWVKRSSVKSKMLRR